MRPRIRSWAAFALVLLSAGLAAAAEAVEEAAPEPGWLESVMPESLRQADFLIQWWQWIGLLVLAALAVVGDRILVFLGRGVIARLLETEKFKSFQDRVHIPEKLWKGAERPFGVIAASGLVLLLLPSLALSGSVQSALRVAATFVLTASCVWASYRVMDLLSVYLLYLAGKTQTKLDDMLVPLLRKIAKVFVVAVGLVFVLQNLHVEVGSLLAGLGVGGLAFALAAKDTVSNVFGSVTVLFDQPFQVGDWVVIDGVEGTVERVGFRSTRIRTFYDSLVTMPNAKLISSVVDNYGSRHYRRYKARFGIAYDTDPWKIEAFCEGLRELVRAHPYTRKDYFHVYFNDLGESALEILVYIFHETPDWGTELRERHRFLVDAVKLAASLGVNYAFPTRTVHIEPSAPPPGAPAQKGGRKKAARKAKEPSSPEEAHAAGRDAAHAIAGEPAA